MTSLPHGLTLNEMTVVRTIESLTSPEGVAPSYRQIGAHIGKAHSRVAGVIAQLDRKGWIDRKPGHRSLRLLRRLTPEGRVEAIDVALEHQTWAFSQGIGIFSMLELCGIETPDELTEADAAGLLAEHWVGVRNLLRAKESGNG